MSRVISATEFKAKCLALLDDVNERGDTIIVTKRGRPVATLKPLEQKQRKSTRGSWIGKVEIVGDIINTNVADSWEMLREAPGRD